MDEKTKLAGCSADAGSGMQLRHLLPLVGLTCAAFIFNTSEFVPIGLLSDIAADFHVSEARAGMLISVYAWAVMLLSLPLMLLVARMEMRRLMLCLVALFTVFQVLSSVSSGYAALMFSRIGVACTHAVFWSIVSPLAVRIVPDCHRALALSLIVTGTSVAMILGLPLGRIVGLTIGWRMTFFCIGAFSLLTLLYLAFVLPRVPSRGRFSVRRLPDLLGRPRLRRLYVITLLVATSYYTGYSYIEPFLKQTAGMPEGWITFALMLFGGAGILGSIAFSKCYAHNPFRFLCLVIGGMSACLWLLLPSAMVPVAPMVLCAAWGMAATAFSVAFQAEVINNTPPEGTAVGMSIFSGIFNLGIGCGTLAGGTVCTYASIAYVGFAGGALALLAFLCFRAWGRNLTARP